MNYSPILITVYDRLDHLKKSVDSLLRCEESKGSILYIASDAAATSSAKDKIDKVRSYLYEIRGFRQVILIERERNVGAVNNYIFARNQVFEKHNTIIYMEDDVIVGKGFLKFINDGLERFKDEPHVVGVCGYLAEGVEGPSEPFFMSSRSPYGFGMWKSKEGILDSLKVPKLAEDVLKNFKKFRHYEKFRPHTTRVLPFIKRNLSSPHDIMIGLAMSENNLISLYPHKSITKSIGNDGSGIHSGYNKRLQNQKVAQENIQIPKELNSLSDSTMMKKVSTARRTRLIWVLNYSIFLLEKYLPIYFSLYKASFNRYKNFKKRTKKVNEEIN